MSRPRASVPRALALLFTTAGAVAFGCTTPPAPPPIEPPAAPPPAAPPSATVLADAAAPPQDAGAAPEPPGPGPRSGAPGSTRGTIACGAKRCRAPDEVCAVVESGLAWDCVPSSKAKDLQNAVYQCDDGTDCPWGKTCCRSFASASEYFVCTTRDVDCSIEVCEEGGARCPAGMACRDGACRPAEVPGPKCGSTRCTGSAPICHWLKGKGECVARERADELSAQLFDGSGRALLACTQNADCGAGFRCCTGGAAGPAASFCTLRCDLANTQQYCATDADCPHVDGLVLKCKKPDAGLPVWSKVCTNE